MRFFFNDTATTEIYTLSLHDALPISRAPEAQVQAAAGFPDRGGGAHAGRSRGARGSRHRALRGPEKIGRAQRLNSSHANISYAVFCLKKKTQISAHHPSLANIGVC